SGDRSVGQKAAMTGIAAPDACLSRRADTLGRYPRRLAVSSTSCWVFFEMRSSSPRPFRTRETVPMDRFVSSAMRFIVDNAVNLFPSGMYGETGRRGFADQTERPARTRGGLAGLSPVLT